MDIEELLRQRYGGDRFNPAAGQTQMSFQEWMDRHPSLRGRGGDVNFATYQSKVGGGPAAQEFSPQGPVDIPDGAKGRGGNLGPTVPQPQQPRKPSDPTRPGFVDFPNQWGGGDKMVDPGFAAGMGGPDLPPKGRMERVAGGIKGANKGMPRKKAQGAAARRAAGEFKNSAGSMTGGGQQDHEKRKRKPAAKPKRRPQKPINVPGLEVS